MARAIDGELLKLEIANIANKLAKSDAQKALMGWVMYCVEHMPTIPQPSSEPPPCYTEEKRNTAYPLCAGRGFANCAHCALWSDFEEDQDETRINRPLTLEELREMDGEPIYIIIDGVEPLKMWVLIEVDGEDIYLTNNLGGRSYYEETRKLYKFKLYRRPPEVSP